MPNTKAEEFLAHYGVKGMRWGKTSASSSSSGGESKVSGPSDRQVKRAQYKADLKSAEKKRSIITGNVKKGQKWTPAEIAALKKSSRRQVVAGLAIAAAMPVAQMALGKAASGIASSATAKRAAAAATAGAQFNTRNMSAIGNLSTFTLRQGANGSWG